MYTASGLDLLEFVSLSSNHTENGTFKEQNCDRRIGYLNDALHLPTCAIVYLKPYLSSAPFQWCKSLRPSLIIFSFMVKWTCNCLSLFHLPWTYSFMQAIANLAAIECQFMQLRTGDVRPVSACQAVPSSWQLFVLWWATGVMTSGPNWTSPYVGWLLSDTHAQWSAMCWISGSSCPLCLGHSVSLSHLAMLTTQTYPHSLCSRRSFYNKQKINNLEWPHLIRFPLLKWWTKWCLKKDT